MKNHCKHDSGNPRINDSFWPPRPSLNKFFLFNQPIQRRSRKTSPGFTSYRSHNINWDNCFIISLWPSAPFAAKSKQASTPTAWGPSSLPSRLPIQKAHRPVTPAPPLTHPQVALCCPTRSRRWDWCVGVFLFLDMLDNNRKRGNREKFSK